MPATIDDLLDALKDIKSELSGKNSAPGSPSGKGGNFIASLGGAIGTLVGGRVGQAGNAVNGLVTNIQKLSTAKTADAKIAGFAGTMSSARSGIGAATGMLSSVVGMAAKAAMGLAGPAGLVMGLAGSLSAPLDAIKQIADAVIGFVQLANPGVVEAFTLAMNDAMAVIGGMLTPVMQSLTIYARTVGDALARFEPILQPLFDSIAGYIAGGIQGMVGILDAMAPLIQIVADGLADAIRELTKGLSFMHGVIQEIMTTIMELFGIRGDSRLAKDASAKGRAVRNTGVSSVEAFSRDVFAASLKSIFSQGKGQDPLQTLPEIKAQIEKGQELVRDIKKAVETVANWVQNPRVSIINAVSDSLPAPETRGWIQDKYDAAKSRAQQAKARILG